MTVSFPNPADLKPGALKGLKVVSMAEQYPGPFCTLILSDMGADVIQVERPETGDPSRFLASFYESLNRNKRSVAVDARVPEQKEALLDLIREADVFLEGFRPGKLAKLGLGYEALAAINPRLIYASISGFGQTGPYRMRPAHDLSFSGLGGALDERIRGDVQGRPPALLLGDATAGLYAVIGVLAALHGRQSSGEGSHIDIAMSDAVMSLQLPFIGTDRTDQGAVPQADPGYGLYETADGRWLTTSIAHEDAYWDMLCRDTGVTAGIGLKRAERVARHDEMVAQIGAKIREKPFSHWEEVFEASGQMWGPALTREGLVDDPHLAARGLFGKLTRQDGAQQSVLRQPVKFSAYDNVALSPAPQVGQHDGEGFGDT
ncbi:CoA transferase [Paracoccus aestuarii]|uniref:CoA transferase n=1 Tax=Paracoccus aestuarii TaxID=453842 RepID=A0A418ZYE9_9RHOB|nr:CaiB/BaiF CoA-transferase family protein [Paracoccus aestuarii]RJL05525.1 CoA transferase [Paracoccus aestuarii]WCQ98608.1 CoA transferase [Paracoccus aestuarii]